MNETPNYYAIIPANVRYNNSIQQGAKLLYGEITALSNKTGCCWAGDQYFMGLYKVSQATIQRWLTSLEKNGYIRRDATKPRAIEIIDDNFNLVRREVVNVPIVGTVAAGQPLLAVENIEGYFPIPAEFMPNEQSFMLKVKGESMVNAGIFDGDQVLVRKQSTAEDGDIVVALIEDGATVKTFHKEKGYYRLQPENDAMDPIIVQGELQILGKVFGVFRLYQ